MVYIHTNRHDAPTFLRPLGCRGQGSRKKSYFFNGQSTKAFSPTPPPRLGRQKNFFSFFFCVLKQPETDFDIFFLHNFWIERAIFLGEYFKKRVKDCEFSDRQLYTQYTNTLILIFGQVILNKIFLIFRRLKIKDLQSNSQNEKKSKTTFCLELGRSISAASASVPTSPLCRCTRQS